MDQINSILGAYPQLKVLFDNPEGYVAEARRDPLGMFFFSGAYIFMRALGNANEAYRLLTAARQAWNEKDWDEIEPLLRRSYLAFEMPGNEQAVVAVLEEYFVPADLKLPDGFRTWFVSRWDYILLRANPGAMVEAAIKYKGMRSIALMLIGLRLNNELETKAKVEAEVRKLVPNFYFSVVEVVEQFAQQYLFDPLMEEKVLEMMSHQYVVIIE